MIHVLYRPLFITFEGLDGSGKSTQLRQVAAALTESGVPHCVTREPGGTELGQEIREIFLDPKRKSLDGCVELLLVFASRRQHLMEVIEPALARGEHVLCDRFTDSTVAYQGHGRGVDLKTIRSVDEIATGSRVPDCTVLIDVPAAVARGRGHSRGQSDDENQEKSPALDRIDAEVLEFYERAREGFLHLAAENLDRIRLVDGHADLDTTASRVREALVDVLPELFPDSEGPGSEETGESQERDNEEQPS